MNHVKTFPCGCIAGANEQAALPERCPNHPHAPHPRARELAEHLRPGDRIVYRDDETPFALHRATVIRRATQNFFDVAADDVRGDEPTIHVDLIVTWPAHVMTVRPCGATSDQHTCNRAAGHMGPHIAYSIEGLVQWEKEAQS